MHIIYNIYAIYSYLLNMIVKAWLVTAMTMYLQ